MSDPRIDAVAAAIEARFPGVTVVRRRCPDPSAYDIECMLDVLNAPKDPPLMVEDYAWEFAFGLYGDEPTPFLVGSYSPEDSAKYFAEELAAALAARRP
jgi:hypothetical protein